jgi:hypothetical protein
MKLALIAPLVLLAGCANPFYQPHPVTDYASSQSNLPSWKSPGRPNGPPAGSHRPDIKGVQSYAQVRQLFKGTGWDYPESCPYAQSSDDCYHWEIQKMQYHNAEYKEEHKGDRIYPHLSEQYVMQHLPQLEYQNCLGQLHDASGPYAAYMIPSC